MTMSMLVSRPTLKSRMCPCAEEEPAGDQLCEPGGAHSLRAHESKSCLGAGGQQAADQLGAPGGLHLVPAPHLRGAARRQVGCAHRVRAAL